MSEVLEFQVFQLVNITCRIFIVLFNWILCFISSVYSYLRSMENYRGNLEQLCKLCGRKVTTRKGYWNAKNCWCSVFFIKTTEESTVSPYHTKLFMKICFSSPFLQLKCVPAHLAIFGKGLFQKKSKQGVWGYGIPRGIKEIACGVSRPGLN